ncbi:MAG: hypothetical protein BroJett024_32870 [Alphaproteobacteria bacterium]|nr:MAG: hypothetical protein BroJett024_32870 [Alphaproteobacteria bacterium]
MRKIILTLAAVTAMLGATVIAGGRAEAMTTPLPAGIAAAVQEVNLAEKVRYVCRRVCDWRGCWRRCWHTAPRYYGYYHRPYRWHRRHWRRW